MAEFLISAGADVNAEHVPRKTPLGVAVLHCHREVAAVLHRHGARIVNPLT
jgi:ankyrin repeat protein